MRILLALLALTFAHAAGTMSEDQGAEELQKELNGLNKQAEDALQQIDKLQALPVPGTPSLNGLPNLSSLPISAEQMSAMKERALKLANDDRFIKSAEALWKSEKRKELLIIQAVFFLVMLLFKAWRQSKAGHWLKRMLIGFFLTIFTWVCLSYVIPAIVLGEPFLVFTSTLFKVLVLGQ